MVSRKSENEPTLHVKTRGMDEILIICFYVYDIIYTTDSVRLMEEFKYSMINEFKMIDLGLTSYFLGLEVKHYDGIFIPQKNM